MNVHEKMANVAQIGLASAEVAGDVRDAAEILRAAANEIGRQAVRAKPDRDAQYGFELAEKLIVEVLALKQYKYASVADWQDSDSYGVLTAEANAIW